ncbi:MAG TPA: hypothetical protein VLB90_10245 [Pseudomonadales bacterium]|nr:hypothetical protein [Pseudomonadales bacterium]
MSRPSFTFADIAQECRVETGCHALHGLQNPRKTGIKIFVPNALQQRYPYNATAYTFLQELRAAIFEYGTIEFPGLPLNRSNHTIAMRSPREHRYSSNPYLTNECQHLHQDTPPYPTAFWLDEERHYFATWIVSLPGLQRYTRFTNEHPGMTMNDVHRVLVPESLANGTGIVVNHTPGLILIDNSEHQQLFHARTCRFDAVAQNPDYSEDAPMYAFNEIGLLNYIDTMDEQRGSANRDAAEQAEIAAFMQRER